MSLFSLVILEEEKEPSSPGNRTSPLGKRSAPLDPALMSTSKPSLKRPRTDTLGMEAASSDSPWGEMSLNAPLAPAKISSKDPHMLSMSKVTDMQSLPRLNHAQTLGRPAVEPLISEENPFDVRREITELSSRLNLLTQLLLEHSQSSTSRDLSLM